MFPELIQVMKIKLKRSDYKTPCERKNNNFLQTNYHLGPDKNIINKKKTKEYNNKIILNKVNIL